MSDADVWFAMLMALLNDEKHDGQYVHHIFCNASRQQPVGNDMCSCPIGKRMKKGKHEPKQPT